MASVMAGMDELQDPEVDDADRQELEGDSDPDSTQILEIIGASNLPSGPVPPQSDPLRRPIDLRELQASSDDEPDEDPWSDVDDGGLVILTRREPVSDSDSETAPQGLVGVIEKVPRASPDPRGPSR